MGAAPWTTSIWDIWSTNFGLASGASQHVGDADGDGDVDALDFLLWQRQFGTSVGSHVTSVPEPDSLWLIAVAMVEWLRGSRLRMNSGRHELARCNN